MEPNELSTIRFKKLIEYDFDSLSVAVKESPIFIVGMAPGHIRKSVTCHQAWIGNRSADLMQAAIKGYTNLYLTNITNHYTSDVMTESMIESGIVKLTEDIMKYKPVKIIAVGIFAKKHLYRLVKNKKYFGTIINVKHPSFILRFKHDRSNWIRQFRKALETIV